MGAQSRDELASSAGDSNADLSSALRTSLTGLQLYRLSDGDQLLLIAANPAADELCAIVHARVLGRPLEEFFPDLGKAAVLERYRALCHGTLSCCTDAIDVRVAGAKRSLMAVGFRAGTRQAGVLLVDTLQSLGELTQGAWQDGDLRQIFDTVPSAILTLDGDGYISNANLAMAKLHGYDSPEELRGRSGLELVAPEDREAAREQLELARVGEAVGPMALRLLRKAGSPIDVASIVRVLRTSTGAFRGFVIIGHDITNEIRQNRLVALQRDLAQQLNSISSIAPALELALQTAIDSTCIDSGAIYFTNPNDGSLSLVSAKHLSHRFAERVRFVPAEALLGKRARSGEAGYLTEDDLKAPALQLYAEEGIRCGAAIPILHEGNAIAVLGVGSSTLPSMPTLDRHVLESIAAQLGGAIVRLRTSEELKRNEETYRLLVEHQADLVAKVDLKGNLLFVSPSFCSTFGKTAQQLLGQSFIPLVHEEDRERLAAEIEGLFEPPHVAYVELRASTAHGWRWLAWQDTAVLDEGGKVVEIIGVGRDITAKHRAEQALVHRSASEALLLDISTRFINIDSSEMSREIGVALEQLRRFLKVDGAALWRFDSECRNLNLVHTAGPAATKKQEFLAGTLPCEVSGSRREAFIAGRAVIIEDISAHPEEAESFTKLAARSGVRSVADVPLTFGNTLLGFTSFLSYEKRPWTEEEVAVLQLVAQVFTNALRRKDNEDSLQSLHSQLLHSQKMEAIGRLAGGVAHDFNNLLTAITGYAEMARSADSAGTPVADELGEILAAAERATRLTNQLLAFSRRQVIRPQIIDLNTTIHDSKKMLARIIGEDIELEFRAESSPCRIRTDPTQIDQILVNLATNSRDAMPNGGRLVIETRARDLNADAVLHRPGIRAGRYVSLTVSDSGVGMDKETQQHAFEPFFSTKQKGKGTGLGLSTVYGVVQQSGGFIELFSIPGQGTRFEILFPRVAVAVSAPLRGRSEPPPRGNEFILLVEDEDMVRALARRILVRQGYRVVDAPGGAEACALAGSEAGEIHLLLTDVVMPKMNGRELYDTLLRQRTGLKVLFMSGYTDDVIAQHGVLEPGIHFVQKPFAARALIEAVRKALDD